VPIYEYECISCGKKFEMRRNVADSDSEIKCPKCGAENPRRAFSLFASGSTDGVAACGPIGST
jgi:putative FmdB family regulatory protein